MAQGLIKMAEWHNPGLAALKSLCRIEGQPVAENMGFDFGPRLNAGSRMGHSDLAARLLCTDDPQEAADIAARLDELNKERRSVEGKVQRAAERQALADGFTDPLVAAAGDGWHQGVLGIVAGRLKGKYKRAAICVGFDEAGLGKGSGRSIPGLIWVRLLWPRSQKACWLKGWSCHGSGRNGSKGSFSIISRFHG